MKAVLVFLVAFLALALAMPHDGKMRATKKMPAWVQTDVPASEPAPMDGCTIELGLQCASVIAGCVQQCTSFSTQCLNCIGSSASTCCPCLKAAFPGFPC